MHSHKGRPTLISMLGAAALAAGCSADPAAVADAAVDAARDAADAQVTDVALADAATTDTPPPTDVAQATDVTPATDVVQATDVTPATDVVAATDVTPATDAVEATDAPPATDVAPATDVVAATDVPPATDVAPAMDVAPAIDVAPAMDVGPATDVVDVPAASDARPDVVVDAGTGTLSLVAGTLSGTGNLDGRGIEARLTSPVGVVYDGARYFYIGESCSIRRVDPTDGYAVTTIAGVVRGCAELDGTGINARVTSLFSMAFDVGRNNLYWTEPGIHVIRRMDVVTGAVTTFAGAATSPGSTDATGVAARFNSPRGLAIIGRAMFVADEMNDVIRRVDLDTAAVTTVAGAVGMSSDVNATGSAARFTRPFTLAGDGAGHLFVGDLTTNVIRQVVLADYSVTTLAGNGGRYMLVDGVGAAARFDQVIGMTSDNAGHLFVTELANQAMRRVDISTRMVTTLAGGASDLGTDDGVVPTGKIYQPMGVVWVGGDLTFVDSQFGQMRRLALATNTLTTLVGPRRSLSNQLGIGGIASDGTNYYLSRSNTIEQLDVDTGARTVLAGVQGMSAVTDGIGAAARIGGQGSIVYGAGALYWYESGRAVIRRMDLATRAVTTLVGLAGSSGDVDGVGSAARLGFPFALVYADGRLYFPEANDRTLRMIDVATRTVTTIAGMQYATQWLDGVGLAARFRFPSRMTYDGMGHMYIVDEERIRRIDLADYRVSTLAGNLEGYVDGVGTAALFRNSPDGIAYDPAGALYISDSPNNVIRRLDLTTNAVTTVVGRQGYSGARLGPLPTTLNYPADIRVLGARDLLFYDTREDSLLRARGF